MAVRPADSLSASKAVRIWLETPQSRAPIQMGSQQIRMPQRLRMVSTPWMMESTPANLIQPLAR